MSRTVYLGKNYGTVECKCAGLYVDHDQAAACGLGIWAGPPQCSFDRLECYLGGREVSLLYMSVDSIPKGATVTSATCYIKSHLTPPTGACSYCLLQIKTGPWGPPGDNTTIGTGPYENTATQGQVTGRRRTDYNGAGGDAAWAGDFVSTQDSCANQGNLLVSNPVEDTYYGFPVTTSVQNWVSGGESNWGWLLWDNNNKQIFWWGDCTASGTTAPYLVVNYTLNNEVMNAGSNTL